MVERRLPATVPSMHQHRSRMGRYHLSDPFLRFHFRFLEPYAAEGILSYQPERVLPALIFITSPDKRTVPVAIQYLITGDVFRWGLIMAASVVAAVPVMVLYYLAQRFVVQGLVAGAVKG